MTHAPTNVGGITLVFTTVASLDSANPPFDRPAAVRAEARPTAKLGATAVAVIVAATSRRRSAAARPAAPDGRTGVKVRSDRGGALVVPAQSNAALTRV